MLQPKLFDVIHLQTGTQSLLATVMLNGAHPIFSGHFPGSPVLPGVCQIEMLKEILENGLNTKLSIPDIGSVKFLNVIEPQHTPELKVQIDFSTPVNGIYNTSASIAAGERFFLKFKGNFKTTNEH
ncbi:MAG: 3-hydroxyacyl-ACP dehydratase [Chitinophagales bacterium]